MMMALAIPPPSHMVCKPALYEYSRAPLCPAPYEFALYYDV